MKLGKSNRQIAEELGISLGTAKNHVGHIIAMLGVSDRT
jgi:NarL family two-component system response regulator LiaR